MKTRIASAVSIALLIAACLVPQAAAQPGATGAVSVTVTVGARIDWHPVDATRLELRSNTPWMVVADTADGARVTVGEPTRGAWVTVAIPENATAYSVTPNR